MPETGQYPTPIIGPGGLDAGRLLSYPVCVAVESMHIDSRVRDAVAHFWAVRQQQVTKQHARGTSDRGARGAVTGGAQMDGFIDLLAALVRDAGIPDAASLPETLA